MTRQELLVRLEVLKSWRDPERSHAESVELLLEYIDDPEIRAVFEQIRRYM